MTTPLHFVLFCCTGNYYRSRFAEAVFNSRVVPLGLPWRAFSRGLATHLVDGDLSPHTACALAKRGIDPTYTSQTRQSLSESDLQRASQIIVLDEAEHRPFMHHQFPAWEDRVTYWSVPDIDREAPEPALDWLESLVLERLVQPLLLSR